MGQLDALEIRTQHVGGWESGDGPGFMGGSPGGGGLVGIGRWLQSKGFRVGEHPAFGDVGGHEPGSYHYIGRAIDVNWGTPGGSMEEWNALWSVAQKVQSMYGGRILESLGPWNDAAHGGSNMHWHLAMKHGGVINEPLIGFGRTGTKVHMGEKESETLLNRAQTMAVNRALDNIGTGAVTVELRMSRGLEQLIDARIAKHERSGERRHGRLNRMRRTVSAN